MVRVTAVLGDYYHPAEWSKESLASAVNTKVEVEKGKKMYVKKGEIDNE